MSSNRLNFNLEDLSAKLSTAYTLDQFTTQYATQSGIIEYLPPQYVLANHKPSWKSWEFKIAIFPEQKNLNLAASILAPLFAKANLCFKMLALNNPEQIISWDGTAEVALNEASDIDPRGAEFFFTIDYNEENEVYEKTPEEIQCLLLSVQQALFEHHVNVGYIPSSIHDKKICMLDNNTPSIFSYAASFKPRLGRNGLLHPAVYNQEASDIYNGTNVQYSHMIGCPQPTDSFLFLGDGKQQPPYNPLDLRDDYASIALTTGNFTAHDATNGYLLQIQFERQSYLTQHIEKAEALILKNILHLKANTIPNLNAKEKRKNELYDSIETIDTTGLTPRSAKMEEERSSRKIRQQSFLVAYQLSEEGLLLNDEAPTTILAKLKLIHEAIKPEEQKDKEKSDEDAIRPLLEHDKLIAYFRKHRLSLMRFFQRLPLKPEKKLKMTQTAKHLYDFFHDSSWKTKTAEIQNMIAGKIVELLASLHPQEIEIEIENIHQDLSALGIDNQDLEELIDYDPASVQKIIRQLVHLNNEKKLLAMVKEQIKPYAYLQPIYEATKRLDTKQPEQQALKTKLIQLQGHLYDPLNDVISMEEEEKKSAMSEEDACLLEDEANNEEEKSLTMEKQTSMPEQTAKTELAHHVQTMVQELTSNQSKKQRLASVESFASQAKALDLFDKPTWKPVAKTLGQIAFTGACIAGGVIVAATVCALAEAALMAVVFSPTGFGSIPAAAAGFVDGMIKGSITGFGLGLIAASAVGGVAGATLAVKGLPVHSMFAFSNNKLDDIVQNAESIVKNAPRSVPVV